MDDSDASEGLGGWARLLERISAGLTSAEDADTIRALLEDMHDAQEISERSGFLGDAWPCIEALIMTVNDCVEHSHSDGRVVIVPISLFDDLERSLSEVEDGTWALLYS
jgi:hypothetical protein